MKLIDKIIMLVNERKADVRHLPLRSFVQNRICVLFFVVFLLSTVWAVTCRISEVSDDRALEEQQATLQFVKVTALAESTQEEPDVEKTMVEDRLPETESLYEEPVKESVSEIIPEMLPEYEVLYHQNADFIGWLKIPDTVIDYPVMQCMEDENFYLTRDFYQEENRNGCLILDNDSNAGIGTKQQAYTNGSNPSTNLIIHGHTMKSGLMFGDLLLYEDKDYGMSHNIICFDSLYEKREYELIAVFYSQVFYKWENVFKYYNFFQADTQEAFDDWYRNIKELSLYDTGVTAEFGDEFITLSCCAYHVDDGRFVVVGKRR